MHLCNIGLSFERPYFMEGLNLMIAKSTKTMWILLILTDLAVFDENHRFHELHKNCDICKTLKNREIRKFGNFYVKRKTTCLRR